MDVDRMRARLRRILDEALEDLGELPATEWRETVAFTLGAMLRLILDLQERVEALEQ